MSKKVIPISKYYIEDGVKIEGMKRVYPEQMNELERQIFKQFYGDNYFPSDKKDKLNFQ